MPKGRRTIEKKSVCSCVWSIPWGSLNHVIPRIAKPTATSQKWSKKSCLTKLLGES